MSIKGLPIIPDLTNIDVFNRYKDPDNLGHTVHLMQYIFPRQFGLHNVFTSTVDSRETTHRFKDYTLREHEITALKKRNKTQKGDPVEATCARLPKRFRGPLVKLVVKLQRLHARCSYVELLKHYCPVEVSASPVYSSRSSPKQTTVHRWLQGTKGNQDHSTPIHLMGSRWQHRLDGCSSHGNVHQMVFS